MKKNTLKQLHNLLQEIRTEGVSMHRRFTVYLISVVAMVLSLILLLLNLTGMMNPASRQIKNELDAQLLSYAAHMEQDCSKIAAYAVSFADQLEVEIQEYLSDHNLKFGALQDNPDALENLQSSLYDTIYLNMQLAPCSGAFYILDTTVNSQLDDPLYNGIYLKYINLYSESTVNNAFSLYRGSVSTGKSREITFHSGWQNELHTDFFENDPPVFQPGIHYILSPSVEIPETWERARFIYVPIRDMKENIIGICGFEINDLYFQFTQKTGESKLGQLVFGLLDEQNGIYTGQFSSNRYNAYADEHLTLTKKKNSVSFEFETERCMGKVRNMQLGGGEYTAVLMLPEAQYNHRIQQMHLKITAIILAVTIFTCICCLFMSRRYLSPLLKKIEQIKSEEEYDNQLRIQEIDDLFSFLEKKDILFDEQMQALEAARQSAEEEARRTKAAYEKALEQYELAQTEIRGLSRDHMQEIDPGEYEFFISNLNSLTPTESRIYELYLSGKRASEIAEILDITENTLKYHNRNIYSKLGISSRKQLLRFSSLKQYCDSMKQDS